MDITRDQQIALDDSLVAPTNRLKIGKSNLQLSSDLKSKEATLQVVYDATATVHRHLIHFKMKNKKHIVNLKYFKEMLQICPKLPNQQFEELPFEEAILTFLNDLGHSGEIKMITDANVNKLHQPWKSFAAVINKCLSEYYAIASGAEPPKTKASVKKKQVRSDKTKTPPTTKGKRLKTSAKAAKSAKKKQPANTSKVKGLTVLSEVTLTEAEQMKLATKRSLIETHGSHASGSGANKGTGSILGIPDVPTYGSDDEQISWNSSDEEDDDEVALNDDDDENDDDDDNDDHNDDVDNQDDDGEEYDEHDDEEQGDDDEQTDSDNDGDDFVHPNDEEIQDANVEGDKMNEEETMKKQK
ncbi:hypothetical protein Tco_0351396 [Tanacetum coccineum]